MELSVFPCAGAGRVTSDVIIAWDVLNLGCFAFGTFRGWDVLWLWTFCSFGRFVAWDVLFLGTLCTVVGMLSL
jgi:hypothetical protein